MTNQSKINQIVRKITQEFKPKKVILFGSYAWGNPTKDSDVDIFVIHESPDRRLNREIKLRQAVFPAGIAVDVVSYTPSEVESRLKKGDFFVKRILSKGKILYGE